MDTIDIKNLILDMHIAFGLAARGKYLRINREAFLVNYVRERLDRMDYQAAKVAKAMINSQGMQKVHIVGKTKHRRNAPEYIADAWLAVMFGADLLHEQSTKITDEELATTCAKFNEAIEQVQGALNEQHA